VAITVLSCMLVSASAVSTKAAFDAWAARHGKTYSEDEYVPRKTKARS
jgi:hypothetical protein